MLSYDQTLQQAGNRDVMIFRCFIPYVNWLPEGANPVIFPKIYCFTMWRTHMRVKKWVENTWGFFGAVNQSERHHFSLASLHTDIAIAICWQTFDSHVFLFGMEKGCFSDHRGLAMTRAWGDVFRRPWDLHYENKRCLLRKWKSWNLNLAGKGRDESCWLLSFVSS